MTTLKVLTIVGTRPEIIRLSRVLPALDTHFDHYLVHTGQNYDYELNGIFFDQMQLKMPDFFLNAAGENGIETIGNVIIKIDRVLEEIQPDAILVLGDTNSCVAVIAAKRRKIPIFHMEAGNRCFDLRVPEEINRKIVDHTADINLPYSSIAREYLLREGIAPDRIIKTGSPLFEVLNHYMPMIEKSTICDSLGLSDSKFFVTSVHREENVTLKEKIVQLSLLLNKVCETYDLPIIVSTHPRTSKRINQENVVFHSNIRFVEPMGYFDYIKLQIKAKAVLSDSGTITEESAILNFPALNLRDTHERPEGFEEASVMLVGLSAKRTLNGLRILEREEKSKRQEPCIPRDYCSPNVSQKVVRIIASYTGYINRVTWYQSDE